MNYRIEEHGFERVERVLGDAECWDLIALLGAEPGAGRRGILTLPAVASLARSERLLALVRPHLPIEPVPVRGIFFDKSATANWRVSWHQDVTLALARRVEVPGFGPWSVKDGIPHVQPPVGLLERMLTVRLHLDPADEDNGALRVIPGTHRLGRLATEPIRELRSRQPDVLCGAAAGDALLMRPLILHASGRSSGLRHRRIVHLEYAGFRLPEGLEWAEAP